jgi:hypothetical protein
MSRWLAYGVATALEASERVGAASAYGERVASGARRMSIGFGRGARLGLEARRTNAAATIIGAELYHTVGDRERALDQLATDFAALQNDIMTQAGWRADPYHAAEGPLFDWYRAVVEPTINEWQTFHANQTGSWTARWATDWSAYEQWQDRLKRLRELAATHGVTLASPAPVDLPQTIWQRGAEGIGGAASSLMQLLKIVIYAAIGITGFVALYAVFRDIRGHGRMALVR